MQTVRFVYVFNSAATRVRRHVYEKISAVERHSFRCPGQLCRVPCSQLALLMHATLWWTLNYNHTETFDT